MNNALMVAGLAQTDNPFLAEHTDTHPDWPATLVEDAIRDLLVEGADTPLAVVALAGALASAIAAYRATSHAG